MAMLSFDDLHLVIEKEVNVDKNWHQGFGNRCNALVWYL